MRPTEIPFVPVVKIDSARDYLSEEMKSELEKFEVLNPNAEYFMLDGSHRTTALTLTGLEIPVIIYESDEDIEKAKGLVSKGSINRNGTLELSFEDNCRFLNEHFMEKKYFMTVKQKTQKMIDEDILPNMIIGSYSLDTL